MVGHKLGEFSPTRQFSGHTPADKKAAETASAPDSAPATVTKTPKATETPKPKENTNAKKWKYS